MSKPDKSETQDTEHENKGAKEAQEEIIRENESFNVPREDTPLETTPLQTEPPSDSRTTRKR